MSASSLSGQRKPRDRPAAREGLTSLGVVSESSSEDSAPSAARAACIASSAVVPGENAMTMRDTTSRSNRPAKAAALLSAPAPAPAHAPGRGWAGDAEEAAGAAAAAAAEATGRVCGLRPPSHGSLSAEFASLSCHRRMRPFSAHTSARSVDPSRQYRPLFTAAACWARDMSWTVLSCARFLRAAAAPPASPAAEPSGWLSSSSAAATTAGFVALAAVVKAATRRIRLTASATGPGILP